MITKDSKNILIADDSLFFRSKLSDILMEAGHKVRVAKDGKEVLDVIRANTVIDLIILDLQMPDVDGFGVLRWLGENGYMGKVPVLVITGVYEAAQVTDRLKSLGASGFMSKELPPEQVVYRINKILFSEKVAEGMQRRRVAVSVPVDFVSGGVSSTGVIINISESGAFIHTNVRLSEGAILALRFMLPGAGGVLRIKGTVRWFPTEIGAQNLFCGCGVMFSGITEADREAIRDFIAREAEKLQAIPDGRY